MKGLSFNSMIIGFLGAMTLRDLIAVYGLVPRNKRFSFLIYNNYDNYIVKETLKAVGLETKDITNTIYKRKFKDGEDIGIRELIQLISKYLIRAEGNIQYGKTTKISTKYYISTVEATYKREYLRWMRHLLGSLISNVLSQESSMHTPDFIITPKGGNTNLGRSYANYTKALFITSKYQSLESSYVSLESGESEFGLKTNYEGAWKLIDKAQSLEKGRKLFGVVVDCNTATGDQIVETLASFNSLVDDLGLPIESVKYVFTLYRAIDNTKYDIDSRFKTHGYKLYRYFDLSESNKELIYKKRGNKKEFLDVYKKRDVKEIDSIIKDIKMLRE